MFFTEKIKNIKTGDKVLEIGPGANPHPRADILLELDYASDAERHAQFGNHVDLVTDKKIVFYNGKEFPFKDKEFDYVICTHVLEHVEDVPFFIREIQRIAYKGYFEYPLAYYEYLYNFEVHVNFLKYDNGVLYYMKKKDLPLEVFRPMQDFFRQTLEKGHVTMLNDLIAQYMEGFEWQGSIEIRKANDRKKYATKMFQCLLLLQKHSTQKNSYSKN